MVKTNNDSYLSKVEKLHDKSIKGSFYITIKRGKPKVKIENIIENDKHSSSRKYRLMKLKELKAQMA